MSRVRPLLSCLLSVTLAVTGCTSSSDSGSPPLGGGTSQAQALAPAAWVEQKGGPVPEEGHERTFEQIASPRELLERAREALGEKYDEKMAAEVEKELAEYHYTPSAEPEPASDPGEPQGGVSFLEDTQRATEQVAAGFNQRVEVRCAVRPCITRGDFDGDGRADLAVQVTEREEYFSGIALLIGDAKYLLAAGTESKLGPELLWLDTWHVEPSSKGLPTEGEALGAVLMLEGASRRAAVYFIRGETKSPTLKVDVLDSRLDK